MKLSLQVAQTTTIDLLMFDSLEYFPIETC